MQKLLSPTITMNTFLQSYKIVYDGDTFVLQILSFNGIGLNFELFLSQETINMFEKVIVDRRKFDGICWAGKNFVAEFLQNLEPH